MLASLPAPGGDPTGPRIIQYLPLLQAQERKKHYYDRKHATHEVFLPLAGSLKRFQLQEKERRKARAQVQSIITAVFEVIPSCRRYHTRSQVPAEYKDKGQSSHKN